MKFPTGKWQIGSYIFVGMLILWFVIRALIGPAELDQTFYVVARDNSWYPIDLRGKNHNMVGFSNDLLRIIAEENGFEVQIVEVATGSLYDGLLLGNYDAVFSSLVPSVVTKRRYAFSEAFYPLGPVLVVRVDSEANSLEDIQGKIIGIESGAIQQYRVPDDSGFVIIPYETFSSAFESLSRNVIDGVIADVLVANTYVQGLYAGRLKVVTSPLLDRGLLIATRNEPRYIQFLSRFDEGLNQLKEDGRYDELLKKWNLVKTEVSESNE